MRLNHPTVARRDATVAFGGSGQHLVVAVALDVKIQLRQQVLDSL